MKVNKKNMAHGLILSIAGGILIVGTVQVLTSSAILTALSIPFAMWWGWVVGGWFPVYPKEKQDR